MPSTTTGAGGVELERVSVGDRPHLGDRGGGDLGQVAARRGPARPASARASSSRSATSRRIRRDEPERARRRSRPRRVRRRARRGSPRAARGWRGCWSAACAARARRRRRTRAGPGSSAGSRRGRRRARAASGRASARARRPRRRSRASAAAARGRGWSAISRAAAVSEAIGRIARPATASPASAASSGAAEHADGEEEPELLDRVLERGAAAGVLDVGRRDRAAGERRCVATSNLPTWRDLVGSRRAEVRGARRGARATLPVAVDDPDRRVARSSAGRGRRGRWSVVRAPSSCDLVAQLRRPRSAAPGGSRP